MKNLIALIFLFFGLSPAIYANVAHGRPNNLLRFIAKQEIFRNTTLSTIIGSRCSRYLPYLEGESCSKAVKKMIEIMDYEVIFADNKSRAKLSLPDSFVFVAFKQQLIANLSHPKTHIYLDDLNQKLYAYLVDDSVSVNIWDFTKKYYPNDAAMMMATFFQDTSATKLHLAYLEKAKIQGNSDFEENKELLSRLIDTINMILDRPNEDLGKLFYPKEVAAKFNKNIYHLYVPLYLTKKLMQEGVKAESAFSATLMLTLTYEFITAASDYRYVLTDPSKITDENTLQDIFEGYAGSALGAFKDKFGHNFENVRSRFKRSTKTGVELLLKH
jgi:hypothetical protein